MRPVIDTCHWAQDYFYNAAAAVATDFPKTLGPIEVPKNLTKRRVYVAMRNFDSPEVMMNGRLEFYLTGNKVLDLPLEYNLADFARTNRAFAIRFDIMGSTSATNINSGAQDSMILEAPAGQMTVVQPLKLQIACDKIVIR